MPIISYHRYLLTSFKKNRSSVTFDPADINLYSIDSLIGIILEACEFPRSSPKFWCKQSYLAYMSWLISQWIVFSLTPNQPTVLSAMAYKPNQPKRIGRKSILISIKSSLNGLEINLSLKIRLRAKPYLMIRRGWRQSATHFLSMCTSLVMG